MALTILAKITAQAGADNAVGAALQKLIAPTRQEAGCIQYDLHQDNDDPSVFVFFEVWETRSLWQDHLNSAHIIAHRAATDGLVAGVEIHELTHIG